MGIASANAAYGELKPLDQFRVVPIPGAIDLQPLQPATPHRGLTYKLNQLTSDELHQFVRDLCGNPDAEVALKRQTWTQWFTRTMPAEITC